MGDVDIDFCITGSGLLVLFRRGGVHRKLGPLRLQVRAGAPKTILHPFRTQRILVYRSRDTGALARQDLPTYRHITTGQLTGPRSPLQRVRGLHPGGVRPAGRAAEVQPGGQPRADGGVSVDQVTTQSRALHSF
jgi:hypothetical protein